MNLKYIFLFFYSLNASFFSNIIKKSSEYIPHNILTTQLLPLTKSTFLNIINQSSHYLKTNKKALISLSSIALGLHLLNTNKKTRDSIIILTLQDNRRILSVTFLSMVILFKIYSKYNKILTDHLYKIFTEHKQITLINFLKIYYFFISQCNFKIFYRKYLNKSLMQLLSHTILLPMIICFIAFNIILCKHNPHIYHFVLKPIIIYFIIKNKPISLKELIKYLIIVSTPLGITDLMRLLLFLSIQILIPLQLNNFPIEKKSTQYIQKIKNIFSCINPIISIAFILYKTDIIIKLFKTNHFTAISLYIVLQLLKQRENNESEINKKENNESEINKTEYDSLIKSNYDLNDIIKNVTNIRFIRNNKDIFLINFNEINPDMQDEIKNNNITETKIKIEYDILMSNRIRLFLIQAISNNNEKKKQQEYLELAFNHYYYMMKNHTFCKGENDDEALKKAQHASCKNGNFDKIFNDILSNLDSPLNSEFDAYLKFTDTAESPLYNEKTQKINYNNITVIKEIAKYNCEKNEIQNEIKENNIFFKILLTIEKFLYKNI